MLKFQFKKLIRHKIVEQQIASGTKPHYRMLEGDELQEELIRKLHEEASELLSAQPEAVASELSDLQQVIDDLVATHGLSKQDVERLQKIRRDKDESFTRGIYVDYIEINENDIWVNYYRKNPDRYPEIK